MDGQATAKLHLSATSGTTPAPADGGGASSYTAGGTNGGRTSTDRGGSKVQTESGAAGVRAVVARPADSPRSLTSNRPCSPRVQRETREADRESDAGSNVGE